MKKYLGILVLLVLTMACKKENETAPEPTSDYTMGLTGDYKVETITINDSLYQAGTANFTGVVNLKKVNNNHAYLRGYLVRGGTTATFLDGEMELMPTAAAGTYEIRGDGTLFGAVRPGVVALAFVNDRAVSYKITALR